MWQEPDVAEKRELFSGIIREAEPHERLLILFSLLSQLLRGVSENSSLSQMKAQGLRAVSAIAFLRESLADKPHDPFHGAFKRFYNHLHRQVIDAIRDENAAGLQAAGRSIGILISEAHADIFIAHCIEQSEWREHRLVFVLDRLFAMTPPLAPQRVAVPSARADAQESAFIPLRSF
jgi:hypothetical protein